MAAAGLTGGEFALIERIRSALPRGGEGVVLGVGDDCAVLTPPPGERLVATVDMLVEGVHFHRSALDGEGLGRRALAVNLSDIASMGARPLWALVSLGLPAWVDDGFLAALYRGIGDLATRYGLAVVGGNLTRLPERLAIDITVVGAAARPVARGGARPGDALYVTGCLGAAAAELAGGRHREPEPRLSEGRALAASGGVRAMIDISDGLVQDLGHVCAASGVGAALAAGSIPVAAGATLEQALYGGEDYELLLAAEPAARLPLPLYRIGELRPAGEGLTLDGRPLPVRGWDHFAVGLS